MKNKLTALFFIAFALLSISCDQGASTPSATVYNVEGTWKLVDSVNNLDFYFAFSSGSLSVDSYTSGTTTTVHGSFTANINPTSVTDVTVNSVYTCSVISSTGNDVPPNGTVFLINFTSLSSTQFTITFDQNNDGVYDVTYSGDKQ